LAEGGVSEGMPKYQSKSVEERILGEAILYREGGGGGVLQGRRSAGSVASKAGAAARGEVDQYLVGGKKGGLYLSERSKKELHKRF